MRKRKILTLFLCLTVCLTSAAFPVYHAGAESIMDQDESKLTEEELEYLRQLEAEANAAGNTNGEAAEKHIGMIAAPGKHNAYLQFATGKSNLMTLKNADKKAADSEEETASDILEYGGVSGKTITKEQTLDLVLDRSFYGSKDTDFIVSLTLYDPGAADTAFSVTYATGKSTAAAATAYKDGLTEGWQTVKFRVTNLKPGANDFDIRLTSTSSDTYAQIEVVNVSALTKDPSIGQTANAYEAQLLCSLGLMDAFGMRDETNNLDKTLTRSEALKMMIRAAGRADKAAAYQGRNPFGDVNAETAPYVAYAVKEGWIQGNGDGCFRPDDVMTVRELLTVYLRALGVTKADVYATALETATDTSIVSPMLVRYASGIVDVDTAVTADIFAGIAYNAMLVRHAVSNKAFLTEMLENGAVQPQELFDTGAEELAAFKWEIPQKYAMQTYTDGSTGRTYHWISHEGLSAIRPYFNDEEWDSTGTRIIYGNDKTDAMYVYNTQTQTIQFLDYINDPAGSLGAVFRMGTDEVYYGKPNDNNYKEFWKIDLNTMKRTRLAVVPNDVARANAPTVSNDGKWIVCNWNEPTGEDRKGPTRSGVMVWINTETGEVEMPFERVTFNPSYDGMGHCMINPVYTDIQFYCHEGNAGLVNDRMYIANRATGEKGVLFRQALNKDGSPAETVGHESWTDDGEWMSMVIYGGIYGPSVAKVNKEGTVREYLNRGTSKSIWHCEPSADGKWIVADTNSQPRNIFLVDATTYEEHLLASFTGGAQHPYQPHPQIDHNGKYATWVQQVDGVLGVSWMDITEFTGKVYEGGKEPFKENIDIISYKDTDYYSEKVNYSGVEAVRAANDSEIRFDVNDDVAFGEDMSATLKITYLDSGMQDIHVQYTSGVKSEAEYADREDVRLTIKRTNSGKWVTKEFEIDSINLTNACEHQSDFVIKGKYSQIAVSDVAVTVK